MMKSHKWFAPAALVSVSIVLLGAPAGAGRQCRHPECLLRSDP